MNQSDLNEAVRLHGLWLRDEAGGVRADLRGADLPAAPIVAGLDRIVLGMVDTDKGMLDMGDWHTCETTHCLAGWATTLAEGGRDLERKLSPEVAGALIWHASVGYVPDFYASNGDAIAELRRRVAEREAAS